MTGDVPAASWLEPNWVLLQFSKQRKRAIEKYVDFVREGVGLPSLWGDLKNQIFLGSEKFVNNKQEQINKKKTLSEVPHLQKRKLPMPLEYYDKKYKDQKIAILNAYLSGGYTLKEIGHYFGKHYSTISRIVKANE
jgi:hypothetical protein